VIIIVSSLLDLTTQKVIEWLDFYKKEYTLLTDEKQLSNIDARIGDNGIKIYFSNKEKNIKLEDVTSFWYRRSTMNLEVSKSKNTYPPIFESQIKSFIDFESFKLKEYLNFKFKSKSLINNEEDGKINKLIVLEYAKQVGLSIPNTQVINDCKNVIETKSQIIKPISEAINFYYEINMCRLLTHDFQPKYFTSNFPTLLQTKIGKLFEIRTFFLGNKFFSIAIFSQQNEKSKVDYRNYDFINKNRSVPFTLPKEIAKKCKKLMNLLKLNSGSIDFIYTKKNEFIFLEVNPIGQFDNVSKVGNYYLEHKIANILADGKY
jgi:ATP-GRASP peptide maturase of grasp-with-spasm system